MVLFHWQIFYHNFIFPRRRVFHDDHNELGKRHARVRVLKRRKMVRFSSVFPPKKNFPVVTSLGRHTHTLEFTFFVLWIATARLQRSAKVTWFSDEKEFSTTNKRKRPKKSANNGESKKYIIFLSSTHSASPTGSFFQVFRILTRNNLINVYLLSRSTNDWNRLDYWRSEKSARRRWLSPASVDLERRERGGNALTQAVRFCYWSKRPRSWPRAPEVLAEKVAASRVRSARDLLNQLTPWLVDSRGDVGGGRERWSKSKF